MDAGDSLDQPLLGEAFVHRGSSKADGYIEECAAVDAVYRKISWRLLPCLFLVSTVSYMDRTNISLAFVGMSGDIGVSKPQYGTAASLFFVTYVVFQIPSNTVLKKLGAPLWLAVILIGWGICASCTGFVGSVNQLYIMRLLLGAFEAGAFPGVFYLSIFYPEGRISFPAGVLCAGLLVGLCISAPLAGGLLAMDGILGFSGWQWLMFIEGIPSILLGFVIMIYLPKLPCSGNFLTRDEQRTLENDMCCTSMESATFMSFIKGVIMNVDLWILFFAGFFHGTVRYVTQFWTPLWIDAMASGEGLDLSRGTFSSKSHRDNGELAAFLTAIPYSIATGIGLISGWSSQRFRDRKYHVGLGIICTGIVFCFLEQISKGSPAAGIVALVIINSGVGGFGGPHISLGLSCLTNENKALGIAWMNASWGLCGLVGPLVVGLVVEWTGSYVPSLYFAGCTAFLAGAIYLVVKDSVRG